MNRRNFLQKTSAFAVGTGAYTVAWSKVPEIAAKLKQYRDSDDLTEDEDYWRMIRQAYSTAPGIINLNNGGVSPQPKTVQDAHNRYMALSNEVPSYYMWRVLDRNREPVREKLATLAGVSSDEIALNRNASEALDTIIFGIDLEAGDEVVLSKQDYPNMVHAWNARSRRHGVRLKWVDLNLPSTDTEALANQYISKFTRRTKVVHLTHMLNWTGQIMPVARVAEVARKRGIKVIVDAAHSFAHLNIKLPDLGADYIGVSLHKWLCASIGTGMLYVRKELISSLWPLIPNSEPLSDDIRKFENLGTRSFPAEMSVGAAIDFHNMIGSERKAKRLHYLKSYWIDRCRDIPGFKLWTPPEQGFSGAIAAFSIEGMETIPFFNALYQKYGIHTSPSIWEQISGIRIAPHVYTRIEDLDKLVKAVREIAAQ